MIVHAQLPDSLLKDRQLKYERLLSKGNKQHKTGTILLVAGYTSITLGFITVLEYGYIMDDWPVASTILVGAGAATTVLGWDFFVLGAIKKKKAKAQLKLMTSKIIIDTKNYIAQPSVGISITL